MNKYQTEYRIEYKTVKINGLDIFYREASPKNSPNNFVVAWLSNIITHVSQLNTKAV